MSGAAEASVNQLAAALRYAGLGWPVFPLHTPIGGGCSCGNKECGSIGKHPRTKDGFKSATTDEGTIRGWWRTWPQANIGIVSGAASGFFVVDVDTDKGGDESLSALLSLRGDFPRTVQARTGSGGRHILFKHPGRPVPNSTQRLGAGLDVRGDGGYIVAAPSLHRTGRTYEWMLGTSPDAVDLADAPVWLLELLKPREIAPPPPHANGEDAFYQRASAYVAKMPPAISGARGHDALWEVVLACHGFRLSESQSLYLILSEYNPRCEPPWSEKEILHKIRDVASRATVPFGYLVNSEDQRPPRARHEEPPLPPEPQEARPYREEPGCDDDDDQTPTNGATQSEALPKKKRIGLQPISVLLAEKIPPTEWLVSPWLETGTIAALVAPPSIGKTLLALWFATQVAAAGGRVAIIEEEGGKRGFQKRLERAVIACGGLEKCKGIDYAFKPRISLMDKADVHHLGEELKGYRFVILDSLARLCTGVDENDTKEMGLILARLDYVREKTGAASLSLHHTNKSKWRPGEVPRLEDGRGSSALAAGLDTVLALSPLPEDQQEHGFVSFEIHVTKQRDEDTQVPPRLVRILMAGPSADVTMEEKQPRVPMEDVRVASLIPQVLHEIPEPPAAAISREELQDKLGKRAADIRAAVNRLIDEGKIKEQSKKRLIRVPFTPTPRDYAQGRMERSE